MNAFLYLTASSARNRLRFALRRARSPRYAIALAVGVLYVYAFLVRPVNRGGSVPMFLGQPAEMIVTLLAVVTLMGSWVFGADATALAFTPAEVSMLFPAPLSRRQLIAYKLYRSQVAVMINAMIWVFVLRRGGTLLPAPLRAVGLWVLFSTLSLHRLGAALVRTSWREHGGSGARRNIVSLAAFGVVLVLIAAGLIEARGPLLDADAPHVFFTALGHVLATAPAYWGLYLFHLVVAPTFAHNVSEWGRAIVPAAGVLALHAWWVLRTDAAFEDAAIQASAERARKIEAMRARRSGATVAPRTAGSTLRLAVRGHPAMAIFWKNMLCLRRTAQLRVFIGPFVMAIAIGFTTTSEGATAAETVAACSVSLAALLLLFGGRMIRNDLRHDMKHLPLLKSLPIPSEQIVLAEVASSAVPMGAIQAALVLVAYIALLLSPTRPLVGELGALALVSPVALLALNAALLTIQNGMAVLFPAWVRLGPNVSTGVETLGQNVLGTVANLIALALALIVPALIAWGVVGGLHQTHGAAIGLVALLASCILAAETYLAMLYLGRVFARAEPAQTD